LTADAMNAMNTFEAPQTVKPERLSGASIENDIVNVTLPAKSVVVLAVK
jgi:alpha-N-arabinofuranosidase